MLLKYNEHQESVEKPRWLSKLSRLKNYITTKIKGIFDRAPRTGNEKVKGESFVIWWVNSSEAIRNITELEWISIDELNNRLKPWGYSMEWFLWKDEDLLDVLVHDNEYVLSQWTTHQAIGETLQLIDEWFKKNSEKNKENGWNYWSPGNIVTIWWCKYEFVMPKKWINKWYQNNPFSKGHRIFFARDFWIKNLDTGQVVDIAWWLKELISKYWFYEWNTAYRTSPQELLKMFPFLVNNNNVRPLNRDEQHNIAA